MSAEKNAKKVHMEGDEQAQDSAGQNEQPTEEIKENQNEEKQELQTENIVKVEDLVSIDTGTNQLESIKDSDQITQSEQAVMVPTTEPQETEINEDSMEAKLILLHQFSSDYFLYKHSPSFKCFEQTLCSQSDLRLTLHFFPPLTDPGLDEAFNYIPPEEEHDPDGADKYINMCKDLAIVPISRVIRSLKTDTLNLKYYGLTLKQMRGIADALKVNSNIKYLIFEDNWMSPEATALIVSFSSYFVKIISTAGAEKLCEGISSTQFLQELDLSYNSLGDKGLKILQPSLIENTSIKKLNISHNNLTEDSGMTLEAILLENKYLEELDLSWNGFYTGPGNKKLCNGLAKNELIRWLNLSWNGIGTGPAMRPITKYLRKTQVLQFIDLSWNRITQRSLLLLRAALIRNKSLNGIKLGHNIYTPDEAYFLASLFSRVKNNNFTFLDMEDMCVNKDFLPLKRKFLREGRQITHGHVLSNYEIYGPDINKLLFQRCRYLAMKPKKKKKKKDFGHFVLSLPDKNVTPQDFQELLKKKKIKKIDKDLLNELMARFQVKNKKIDSNAMKAAYMKLYPDTVLPEEKKKKKKKKKKKGKKPKKKE
ncbi:uncharacterized protein LOC123011441 isoform X2 [Tribolium madens]|uniref:uncharacterized protein LOC123011441 isoform X2 n=1 Tax=Tribolium madens TaxID=41895 RepID=UPI001CF731E1|nr:uncharacterized protein LOC123011441 isoform X2 [Tribolium madens]